MPSDGARLNLTKSALEDLAASAPETDGSNGAWLHECAGDSAADVSSFCRKNKILDHLKTAKTIADECFPFRKALRIYVDDDPDEEGQWIIVEVTTDQDVDHFLTEYNRCVAALAKKIPNEGLALIRSSYNFA